MGKKISVGIVWANPLNKNLGVGALAYSAYSLISDVAKENKIDIDIVFIGAGNQPDGKFNLLGKEISYLNVKGMDFYSAKSFLKMVLLPRKLNIGKMLSTEVLFDVGEGDSFTDIYGEERFYRFLNSKRFFSLLGKKQVLFPQTIGPFNDKTHEQEAFSIMGKLHTVIGRDNTSYLYLKKFLPEQRIMESVDIAFYLPYSAVPFSKDVVNVGLNVSGLLWNGGYDGKNQFKLKSDYQPMTIDIIERFSRMDNLKLHLVPHVVTMDGGVEDDYAVCKQLHDRYPSTILAPEFLTPVEAKGYIAGLDFFTGARMHTCIAAYSSGVPVFPLGYSRKFSGLFKETLQYPWMGDCVLESNDAIVEHLLKSFERREELAKAISYSIDTIVNPRLLALKEVISEVISE